MELDKIAQLLEKYFEGDTNNEEEAVLRAYFNSSFVAPEMSKYSPLFKYFETQKEVKTKRDIRVFESQKSSVKWFLIASSVVVFLGMGILFFQNFDRSKNSNDLGTFDDPQLAFEETQKALELLSQQVNVGIESVRYVQTYKDTRDRVFVAEN